MLLPKNMSKEKTLESHIIYLFPRECLHFSGERLLTEEKVHLEQNLGLSE